MIAIHSDQIERYGGSFGIRDRSLLETALAMPEGMFSGEGLHPSSFEKAAAYLFHLVKNYPFVDGNKRADLAVGLALLAWNDVLLTATDEEPGSVSSLGPRCPLLHPASGMRHRPQGPLAHGLGAVYRFEVISRPAAHAG